MTKFEDLADDLVCRYVAACTGGAFEFDVWSKLTQLQSAEVGRAVARLMVNGRLKKERGRLFVVDASKAIGVESEG